MNKLLSLSFSLFGLLAFVPGVPAQVLFSSGAYSQNFDSLLNSGWTDNSTLLGWYASKTASPNTVTNYRTSSGTDATGAIYSFGASSSTERALGSIGANTPGSFAYGVRFTNDTSLAVTNLMITYTGEQWRNSGVAVTQSLAFSYRISNASITDSDAANANAWTAVNTLNFNTPTVSATATTLDGNAAANRQTFSSVPLGGAAVYPGQEIFFRWYDTNDSGADHAVAVDDLTINFATVAAVTNAPAIPMAGQPQNRTNNAGTDATFTVSATGTAPYYQWRKDGNDLSDGGNIYGSTTPSLLVSNVLAADAAGYAVVVTNSVGSVTSSVAKLTVIDPAINTQPVSQIVVSGDTGNFFVGAAGTVLLTYQWRHDGVDIPGANVSSLNVGNAQSSDQGAYTIVVGSGTGSSITSSPANLTLLATPANRLTRWDFNATNLFSASAPAPVTGSGTAALVGGTTAVFNGGSFSDPAGPPGINNSGWTSSTYPGQGTANKTAGVQFNVSTAGSQDILLAWEERHSPASSKYMRLQISTDGVNFVDVDVITIPTDSTFEFFSSNLSNIPGVNDNANFAFRFVSEWESTAIGNNNMNYVATADTSSYNTGDTVRFDLVTVFGNPLGTVVTPIPLTLTKISNGVVLSWSDATFGLQAAPAVTGVYTNIPVATSPYTNFLSDKLKFFRLIH